MRQKAVIGVKIDCAGSQYAWQIYRPGFWNRKVLARGSADTFETALAQVKAELGKQLSGEEEKK